MAKSSVEEKNNLSIDWFLSKYRYQKFLSYKYKITVKGIKLNNTLLDFLQ